MATKKSGLLWRQEEARGGVNTAISQKRDVQGTWHLSAKNRGGERWVGDSAMGPATLYFLLRPNLVGP